MRITTRCSAKLSHKLIAKRHASIDSCFSESVILGLTTNRSFLNVLLQTDISDGRWIRVRSIVIITGPPDLSHAWILLRCCFRGLERLGDSRLTRRNIAFAGGQNVNLTLSPFQGLYSVKGEDGVTFCLIKCPWSHFSHLPRWLGQDPHRAYPDDSVHIDVNGHVFGFQ